MLIDPVPLVRPSRLGHVHFIAIGGAGMSGIAHLYIERGIAVSGSDQIDSPVLWELAAAGADVWVGHDAARLGPVDTVVISSAIRPDNVELVEARRRGLRVWHRSAALAALMLGSLGIGVAGTHGKTTTSAMLAIALTGAGLDPSYVIGAPVAAPRGPATPPRVTTPAPWEPIRRRLAVLPEGGSARLGHGAAFVVEADESDGSFRQYPLRAAIVTTIDADHLDNWGTVENYRQGFAEFARGPGLEMVVCAADDPGAAALAAGLRAEGRLVLTYGEAPTADVRIRELVVHGFEPQAEVDLPGWSGHLRLQVPGRHNLLNAAAALAVGHWLGVDPAVLVTALAAFRGTARRFTVVGQAAGVTVVDDYAHHPSEVQATLAAARTVQPDGRVVACFQPHLYTRTRDFADAFGAALAAADEAVVTDIYKAREDPLPGITGRLVAAAVTAHGGVVHYVPALADVAEAVAALARPGDLVLTLGAGTITALGPDILQALGDR
jgi:UDP-N-acetylmuramate--alanine ligase